MDVLKPSGENNTRHGKGSTGPCKLNISSEVGFQLLQDCEGTESFNEISKNHGITIDRVRTLFNAYTGNRIIIFNDGVVTKNDGTRSFPERGRGIFHRRPVPPPETLAATAKRNNDAIQEEFFTPLPNARGPLDEGTKALQPRVEDIPYPEALEDVPREYHDLYRSVVRRDDLVEVYHTFLSSLTSTRKNLVHTYRYDKEGKRYIHKTEEQILAPDATHAKAFIDFIRGVRSLHQTSTGRSALLRKMQNKNEGQNGELELLFDFGSETSKSNLDSDN